MTASQLPATMKSRTPTLGSPLDTKLQELLLSGDSPVVGPDTAKTLAAFAAEPEPALPTEAEVTTMIAKLAMATAQSRVSEAEAEERVSMYWLALRDVPTVDLRIAFVELLKTAKFLPTPAEVRAEAIKAGELRRYAKSRARHLAWKHEIEWQPEGERMSPDELRALMVRPGQNNEAA